MHTEEGLCSGAMGGSIGEVNEMDTTLGNFDLLVLSPGAPAVFTSTRGC